MFVNVRLKSMSSDSPN